MINFICLLCSSTRMVFRRWGQVLIQQISDVNKAYQIYTTSHDPEPKKMAPLAHAATFLIAPVTLKNN